VIMSALHEYRLSGIDVHKWCGEKKIPGKPE